MEKFFEELGKRGTRRMESAELLSPSFPWDRPDCPGRAPAIPTRRLAADSFATSCSTISNPGRRNPASVSRSWSSTKTPGSTSRFFFGWRERLISISTSFQGLFMCSPGSSIHSMFTFEDARSVSSHLRVGKLRMERTQIARNREHRADHLRTRVRAFVVSPRHTLGHRRGANANGSPGLDHNLPTSRRISRSIRFKTTL
jgi:hypothetical protein